MSDFLKAQTKKFQKDTQKLAKRRDEWNICFEKWAIELINHYIEEAEKSKYYENLYVTEDTETRNQSFIQFYAGKHPTGISKTVIDKANPNYYSSCIVEDSGCLSIVQSPTGHVFFMVFPSKSEAATWEDDYIILRYFRSPKKIKYYDLRKAIEFYLRFARYTSIRSQQTIYEKLELCWIKFKFQSVFGFVFKHAIGAILKIGAPHT